MDFRCAAEEADRTARSRHPAGGGLAYSGGGDAAEWLVPKAMWLADNEPETYARAGVICECLDYVNFMLTGRWVASRMNAACKWNYDSAAGRFVDEIYAELRCPDLPGKFADRRLLRRGCFLIEASSAEAAEHLGLPAIVRSSHKAASTPISAWSAPTRWPGEFC